MDSNLIPAWLLEPLNWYVGLGLVVLLRRLAKIKGEPGLSNLAGAVFSAAIWPVDAVRHVCGIK